MGDLANKIELLPITDLETRFVNEMLNNGFNKVQAMRKINTGIAYFTAAKHANDILKRSHVKAYLKQRQTEIRELTNVHAVEVLHKLKTWVNSDPTDFIGLTVDDLKELPAEIRQCINSIDHKKKTYVNRRGEEVVEEHIKVTLVDKSKTMDMINKHIGFYSADNKQKITNINIDKLNVNVLNALLDAVEQQ